MSAFGGSSTCAVVAVGGCLDRRHDVHRPRDCICQEYNLVRGEKRRGEGEMMIEIVLCIYMLTLVIVCLGKGLAATLHGGSRRTPVGGCRARQKSYQKEGNSVWT